MILMPVCFGLLRGTAGMDAAFGPDTPARGILTCVYIAILIISLYALVRAGLGAPQVALGIALVLFPLQILYKAATAIVVGVDNPVVIANLGVIALHSVTLAALWLRP
jgi:hypothetical protein